MDRFLEEAKKHILADFLIDQHIKTNVFLQKLVDEIREGSNPARTTPALTEGYEILGLAILEGSKLDSDHFGIPIGRCKMLAFLDDVTPSDRVRMVGTMLDTARELDMSLVMTRVPITDLATVQALERQGAISTDSLATLYVNLVNRHLDQGLLEGIEISEAQKADREAIAEIARSAYSFTHYQMDPNLDQGKSNEVYVKWSLNLLDGLGRVHVAKDQGEVIGYIGSRIEKLTESASYGNVDLVAVKEDWRNKGVSGALLSRTSQWASQWTKSLYIRTQIANMAALRAYLRWGFKVVSSSVSQHIWLRDWRKISPS